MQVSPIQMTNYNNNVQPQFTGGKYDKVTEKLAKDYFVRFYNSKFAEKFVEKTSGVKNMTTHMSALGATLISGMYIVRTLQNEKLDKEKRKTLAINDALTWGLSTAGSYFLDAKLGNWWEGVTTRFAANYLTKHPEAKNMQLLGNWDPKNIYEMIDKAPQMAIDKYEQMKKTLSAADFEAWLKKVNFKEKHFEQLKEQVANGAKPKNILELNLDVLRNKDLTTMIKGMGVLKTLFIFGMVYRYVVPVLVMKPANKLGAYIHKKNAEKEQPGALNKTV